MYILPHIKHVEGYRYVIYGTGTVASQYCEQLKEKFGHNSVAFFIESQPSSSEFMGLLLTTPEHLVGQALDKYRFILTSFASMDFMIEKLVSVGVREEQIIKAVKPSFPLKYTLEGYIDKIENILFYPEVTKPEKLDNILSRIDWYIPETKECSIQVTIPSSLTRVDKPENARFVSDIDLNAEIENSSIVLIWDKNSLLDPLIEANMHKAFCVDETYYSIVESSIYREIYYYCLDLSKRQFFLEQSKKNYARMSDEFKDVRKSYLFGTGPSLEQAYNYSYHEGFNVICNSIVKNKELVKHINPSLLVFADPVFHFSPCEYSKQFRNDAVDVILEYGCFCMIPYYTVPLILAHYPYLEEKIIGLPFGNNYNLPTVRDFHVKSSANILTLYMIPVASAISGEINIIGCDGRQKNETYFWKHNSNAQYEGLMRTVFEMHPSFFRGRVYEDYYDEHCLFLKELIEFGEGLGRNYYSLTSSFIPVLIDRMV